MPQHRERILIVGFREPVAFDWDAIPLPPKGNVTLSHILHKTDGSEPLLPWDGERFFNHTSRSVQDTANAVCDAKLQSAEACRTFNVRLIPIISSAKTFNRAVRENSAAEIPAMLSALAGLREAVGAFFPPDMVTQLRARLDAAYGLVVRLGR